MKTLKALLEVSDPTITPVGVALAARGHVPGKSFASKGIGPGQLEEPTGVAVNEATGDVYVADKKLNRVSWFSSTGAFEGEVTGPSAEGMGIVTDHSAFIETPGPITGAFSVGEEISAEGGGLEAGTEITSVTTPAEALKEEEELHIPVAPGLGISKEATKTEEPATLKAHQSFAAPEAIAIDNPCSLHKPKPLPEPGCRVGDPSAGDVYVLDAGHEVIDKFTPEGAYVGQVTVGGQTIEGVGVGAHGGLWVGTRKGPRSFSDASVNVTDAKQLKLDGESLTAFATTAQFNAAGFAVDGEEELRVCVELSDVDSPRGTRPLRGSARAAPRLLRRRRSRSHDRGAAGPCSRPPRLKGGARRANCRRTSGRPGASPR
jgi:hypothetical protein